MKQAFELVDCESMVPRILKADITNTEAVSWREAKKQLRKWYLDQAAALRKLTEKDYFD